MSTHALAFKVLRLRPSELPTPDQGSKSFFKDVSSAARFRDHPLEDGTSVSEDRMEFSGKGQLGVSGAPNFGPVYLGQNLAVAVALCNQSAAEVYNVGIRVEIQSDHGKSVLLDTMPTQGIASLAPGAHHEFVVKHDIRDLGPHTLLCASSYVTAASLNEPKYSPQAFKIQVLNPLIVRTKHRGLGSSIVFLEATIENKTDDSMLLESVDLAVAIGYSSQNITSSSTKSSDTNNPISPLDDSISSAPVLHPGGGAASYLFKLTRIWQKQQQPQSRTGGSSARTSPRGDNLDGSALGKLDIKWRGALGDLARLQTQIISGNPRPHRDLRLEVIKFPERILVAEPFLIDLAIVSGVDRRLGPLKVSYHPAYKMETSMSGPIGGTTIQARAGARAGVLEAMDVGGAAAEEEGIVLDGLQSECIHEVAPRGRAYVTLSMLPRIPGRQYIQGLILTDERDGSVYDSSTPIEVYVEE